METIGLAWDGTRDMSSRPSIPDFLRSAFGMDYLLRALERARQHFEDDELQGALQAFSGADILMTDAVARRQQRDRAWELLVACIVAPSVRNLHLGGNASPDIIFDHDGARFGIECKMLNSQKPGALVDAVVDAAKQLEKSTVEFGVVAVDATCLLQHSQMDIDHRHRMFRNHREAFTEVESMLESRIDHARSESTRTRLTVDAKTGLPRDKTRKVLFLAQTVVLVAHEPVTITSVSSLGFRAISLPLCETFESMFRRNTLLIR
jgi:hypothetical protein